MTLKEQAEEVLRLERVWMDWDGDDDTDEDLRYAFIEAAHELAERISKET
ncbi:hypothetical protein PBI_KALPINE_80 [Mycobacterium phage Kalpine]|nr:hypothetical protein PBI_KALPINE_80 [Mycobacterium phage Kalpine]